jgi:lipoate-protein ligase A
VTLDPGDVVVSVALAVPGRIDVPDLFRKLSDWLIAALERIGLPGLSRAGSSDLVRGDRKVAGACLFCPRGVALFSASLLVTPDVEAMERYLAHPPREPAYRRGRSHRDFVAGLGCGGLDAAEVEARLRATLRPPRTA